MRFKTNIFYFFICIMKKKTEIYNHNKIFIMEMQNIKYIYGGYLLSVV